MKLYFSNFQQTTGLLATIILAANIPSAAKAQTPCVTGGFVLPDIVEDCTYNTLLDIFTTFFNDPANVALGCTRTAEQELQLLLGVSSLQQAQDKVHDVCEDGYNNYALKVPFEDIPEQLYGDKRSFIADYFNGGTYWNEEYATLYPSDDGELTNVLEDDAAVVDEFYDGKGQYGMVAWPDYIPNFQNCDMQVAYCCWPQDRQANDNNGNCGTPYDQNCIDRDPADNTDLCYVDLDAGKASTGFNSGGEFAFPFDDNNNAPYDAEGPVHCHGFAWADDTIDPSRTYKANNLFYVSMYDHMYQRGYVREIPGAPMCACAEQMPVVSRSDCTEMAVDQTFKFHFQGGKFHMTVVDISIDFNACDGLDRRGEADSNDLFAYANRLYIEGRFSLKNIAALGKKLVGDDPNVCRDAEKRMMAEKGYDFGYNTVQRGSWMLLAGLDSFAPATEVSYGLLTFRDIFASSPTQIIERICPFCVESHRHIFYKRLTPIPPSLNLVENLKKSTSQEQGQIWGTDFTLHSAYADAVSGANPWLCPNGVYQYYQGFPGNCGPYGEVRDQDTIFGRWDAKADVAYFLEARDDAFSMVTTTTVGEYKGESAGMGAMSNNKLYLSSTGSGIGGSADGMQLYYNQHAIDVEAIAKFHEFSPATSSSDACLIIKESLEPGSRAFSICASGTNTLVVQRRYNQNGWTPSYGSDVITGPIWMRLLKVGSLFQAFTSDDGLNWLQYQDSFHDEWESGSVIAGVGVASSTWRDDIAEAVFSDFSSEELYWPSASPSVTPAPTTGVASTDIGTPVRPEYAGSASYGANRNVYYVEASGGGTRSGSDGGHFVNQQRSGDFTVTAFVESVEDPSNGGGTVAGVMIRDTLDPGAPNVCMQVSKSYGTYATYRANPNSGASTVGLDWRDSWDSIWVRIQREGNFFTAARSLDSVHWEELVTAEISMTDAVETGIFVSSGSSWALGKAIVRNLSVST